MEKTMFKRFSMGQNLRSIFHSQQIPTQIHAIIGEYDKTFCSDIRGTFLNDDLASDGPREQEEQGSGRSADSLNLPMHIRALLQHRIAVESPLSMWIPHTGVIRQKVTRLGQSYQIPAASVGDSRIVFRHEHNAEWSAGCIRTIFSHTRYLATGAKLTQTFLLIDEYSQLADSDVLMDPFRNFPILGGRLFYNHFNREPVLLEVNDIVCHFAHTKLNIPGIDQECIHALPLDKVCPLLESKLLTLTCFIPLGMMVETK